LTGGAELFRYDFERPGRRGVEAGVDRPLAVFVVGGQSGTATLTGGRQGHVFQREKPGAL